MTNRQMEAHEWRQQPGRTPSDIRRLVAFPVRALPKMLRSLRISVVTSSEYPAR